MNEPAPPPKHEQFMTLFVRYEPAIHALLTSLLANLEDAEEVLQEVSLIMWRKFDQFERGTSFRNWAFQIARLEAMNFRRKRQRDRHVFDDRLLELLADEAAQHAAELEEERRALAHCIAKLDARDREVLSGCYQEGRTIKWYARTVGRTANAVRKHLARIRATLSVCVRQTLGLEGL